MKIIRSGNPKRHMWWLDQVLTCSHCGCEFMIEDNDQVAPTDDQRNGSYLSVECPECTYRVTLVKP